MIRQRFVIRFCRAIPLALLLAAACSAPSPVDEVVDSYIAARGGVERLTALNSVRFSGTATASGGRIAKVVLEMKRPGLYRLEFSAQGTKAVFAHDNESGWQIAPLEGQLEPERTKPENDAPPGLDERDVEGHLVNWREKGHLVELMGIEALESGDAYKLKVTLKSGAVRYDYIDVESRMRVRSDITQMMQGREVQVEEIFSDFREVDGIIFAHAVETHISDRPESIRIIVESVDLNPELEDERFMFPG